MRQDLSNAIAAVAVLLLASLLVQSIARPGAPGSASAPAAGGPAGDTVIDAGGAAVPVGEYRRIASASITADSILPELVHVDRIVLVTEAHRRHHPAAFRTAHAAVLRNHADLEAILPHDPDLIVVSNTMGDPSWVARARELGCTVFDLGATRGRATLLPNIRRLGRLLGVAERGDAIADRLAARLDRLPLRIPTEDRRPAIYAAAYGSQIYGGTIGSSYHDVLTAAGLVDVAAGAFPGQGWPQLRIEDLLRLEPAIIVTMTGNADRLRALPGMDRVEARIVEIDGGILGDPALILPAAEAVQQAVYGPPAATR